MSDNRGRAYEGGSLATFLVVGLVLAILVIGGVYTLQKRGPQAPSKPTASPTVAKSPSSSPRPMPSQKPKTSPQATAPSRSPSVKAPSSSPLPATGPSDGLTSIFMLAGLVGMVIAYIRSRSSWRFAYQVD